MKNKEIEELLKYLKDEKWDYYPADLIPYKVLLMEERDLLLSYIEQLQQDYDFLNEKYDSTIKYNEKLIQYNEEYKLRIDKAIEYIEKHTDKLKKIVIPKIDFNYKELLNILKGDSDYD